MDKKLLTTLAQGAIGGLSPFGIYHAYVSQKMIDEHNAKLRMKWDGKLNEGNKLKKMEQR
jgi:hypothetical protein